ncbi:MAG: hypothetical protein AAB439_00560 [Patescibacteria group bacterium]
MLHLLIGVDVVAAKAEARKRAKGEVVVFGEGAQSFDTALSYLGSQGLFAPKISLLFDRALESAEGKALFEEHAETLHSHDTDVFVIETSLNAEVKKLFPKGVEVTDFGKKEAEEKPMPFTLTDLFMAGDRKGAWIEYQKLLGQGLSAEEIHGTLSWAVRSALLSAKTKSADEAGLKPFVYTKSKRFAEKLGVNVVENLSRKLVHIYHRARAGQGDMTLGIEKLILEKS